jgi:hypothetical protein
MERKEMTNSKQSLMLKQVFEKIFLQIDEREIDYLTRLQWDDLVSYVKKEYGEKFAEKFTDNLLCLITKEIEKEKEN